MPSKRPRKLQLVLRTRTLRAGKSACISLWPSKAWIPGRPFPGAAFSLVEIMVVLVIIGLLAGLVGINVRGYLIKAKRNAAKAEIATICDALEAFYTEFDRYPTNEEGLLVLTEGNERLPEALLDREPLDPWGRGYVYNQPGREGPYEVLSLGADGREGGEAADADLGSWDQNKHESDPEL